jgi:dCTP diphosphatase
MLALTGELGELAEIFQFKGDDEEQSLSLEEQDKVGQEIADVTIYLLRLADVCEVSLGEEMKRMGPNECRN